MKILFTGDREFHRDYWAVIWDEFEKLAPGDEVIVGDCPTGVDRLVRFIWFNAFKKHGINLDVHEADWDEYGKAAGPIRNQEMVDLEPDKVIAVHEDFSRSKGTKHCAQIAQKAKLLVYYPLTSPSQ